MKKTAIVVSGPANQGKSFTVKEVAHFLEQQFPDLNKQVINEGADITYIFTIDKIKIGIESQGDPYSRLMDNLPFFVSEGCEIIICASRTSGMTVDAVNILHDKHSFEIIWSPNLRSWHKDQMQLNSISAKNIVDLFKLLKQGQL